MLNGVALILMSYKFLIKMKIKAFASANISCFFKIVENSDPRWMGSLGLGFTLNEGVTVAVAKAHETKVFFNDKIINLPPVKRVLSSLTTESINVYITSVLPLGSGFGLSGASALATAYAVNKLLNLYKSEGELAIIAHTAEVISKTGLGDVANQYFGGMVVKFKPSSYFNAEKIPLTDLPIYCKYFSKIDTALVLSDEQLKNKINQAADTALMKLQKLLEQKEKITLAEILKLSKKFAVNSDLLQDPEVIKTIEEIEKNEGHASMIMLGNAVMSDMPFAGATKYIISDSPAHLL